MVGLIGVLALVQGIGARAEFATERPLTWLMLAGFVAVLLGSAYLWFRMEVRPRPDAGH